MNFLSLLMGLMGGGGEDGGGMSSLISGQGGGVQGGQHPANGQDGQGAIEATNAGAAQQQQDMSQMFNQGPQQATGVISQPAQAQALTPQNNGMVLPDLYPDSVPVEGFPLADSPTPIQKQPVSAQGGGVQSMNLYGNQGLQGQQPQQAQAPNGSDFSGLFNMTGTAKDPNMFSRMGSGYNSGGLMGSLGQLLTHY